MSRAEQSNGHNLDDEEIIVNPDTGKAQTVNQVADEYLENYGLTAAIRTAMSIVQFALENGAKPTARFFGKVLKKLLKIYDESP